MTATELQFAERGGAMTLKGLRAKCEAREENCYDDFVSLKSLSMDAEHPGRLIVQRGPNAPRESFPILEHVYSQASGVLYGLPGGYLQKLVLGEHKDPELAARNFNFWVGANKNREVLLRFWKGEESVVRAMLPASWNPIPYIEMVERLIAKFGEDHKVTVETFNQKQIVINITTGKLKTKTKTVGDAVAWGLRFRDSDAGFSPLLMMPYTLTLACTNGMTTMSDGACVTISHSGKTARDLVAVLGQVRQGVDMILNYGTSVAVQMEQAESVLLSEEPARMEAIFARIAKKHDVTKLQTRHAQESWELEAATHPKPTVLRLANSYTRAANSEEIDEDGRFKLQGVGGVIIATALTETW